MSRTFFYLAFVAICVFALLLLPRISAVAFSGVTATPDVTATVIDGQTLTPETIAPTVTPIVTTITPTASATTSLPTAIPTDTLPTAEPVPQTNFSYGSLIDPALPFGPVRVGEIETTDRTLAYTDSNTWIHTITIPDAAYLMVHFDKLHLAPGDYVIVSDGAGGQLGQYPHEGMLADETGSWSASVTGETIQIELVVDPATDKAEYQGVHIDSYARGYPQLNQLAAANTVAPPVYSVLGHPVSNFELFSKHYDVKKSVCNANDLTDVICSAGTHPTEYGNANAVVRLLIGGVGSCTGFRLSALNRIVTNSHCVGSAATVLNTEVHFDDENTTCGGATSPSTQVTGANLLLVNNAYDVAVFDVNSFATVSGFGHLDPDFCTVPTIGDPIYIPQHAGGLPQQFGIASDSNVGGICRIDDDLRNGVLPNTAMGYFCDTDGGSSGSPVISSSSHKVVALHHAGAAGACGAVTMNSGIRMDLLWPIISSVFPGQYSPCVLPTSIVVPTATATLTPLPTPTENFSSVRLISPTGISDSAKPTYQWYSENNAIGYYLWVQNLDTQETVIAEWLTLDDFTCDAQSICRYRSLDALSQANHSWYLLPRYSSGEGEWSDPLSFSNPHLPPTKPAIAPEQLFPANVTISNRLQLAWSNVSVADSYDVQVFDAQNNLVFSRTIDDLGKHCSDNCSLTANTFLETGVYQWYIRAKNCGGTSDWSAAMQFTVTSELPVAPSLLPNISHANSQPKYSWMAVEGATHYYLEVLNSNGVIVGDILAASDLNCRDLPVCEYTPQTPLLAGSYQWHVAAWSPNGYSAWSSPLLLEVP